MNISTPDMKELSPLKSPLGHLEGLSRYAHPATASTSKERNTRSSCFAPPKGAWGSLLTQPPKMVTVGTVVPDFRVTPTVSRPGNNKLDAVIDVTVGGCPVNTGVFGAANGIPTAAISVQKAGLWSEICQGLALERGVRLLLQQRDAGPAVSLVTPNGIPGQYGIYTQRMEPVTVPELTPEMTDALTTAQAVIVGPMRWNADTKDLLFHIAALARKAYRAMIPHPDMIGDSAFASVAQQYNYVQVNASGSRLLDGAVQDPVLNACRLSFLTHERNDCAVTNGAARGYLWSGRWFAIDPPKTRLVDDTGCGDSFAAAYVIGRVFFRLSAESALVYAIKAAAATATQLGVARPMPYTRRSADC
jgi:sugar/nucleoside kinase (ribokinase family)